MTTNNPNETPLTVAGLIPEPLRELLATWVSMELEYRQSADRLKHAGQYEQARASEADANMLSFCSRELLSVAKRMDVSQ